jgi:hypothetical protein
LRRKKKAKNCVETAMGHEPNFSRNDGLVHKQMSAETEQTKDV